MVDKKIPSKEIIIPAEKDIEVEIIECVERTAQKGSYNVHCKITVDGITVEHKIEGATSIPKANFNTAVKKRVKNIYIKLKTEEKERKMNEEIQDQKILLDGI